MSICIIPARGGSKRIPRKNIRDFCGKPMIVWSIETAQNSGCFEQIIVSTDDTEIAQVARNAGADVPFMRPDTIADDHATTIDVIEHAIQWLESNGQRPEMLCCLYATAPFARSTDIVTGKNAVGAADFAFPVTSFAFPIQRAVKITDQGGIAMFHPEHAQTRSQDLEEAYHDAGQFYWGKTIAWQERRPFFGPATVPLKIPRWRVQDIDTPEDWTHAEMMFRALGLGPKSML